MPGWSHCSFIRSSFTVRRWRGTMSSFLGMCPEVFRGDNQDACSLPREVQKYTHTYLERDRKQMWQNADSWHQRQPDTQVLTAPELLLSFQENVGGKLWPHQPTACVHPLSSRRAGRSCWGNTPQQLQGPQALGGRRGEGTVMGSLRLSPLPRH